MDRIHPGNSGADEVAGAVAETVAVEAWPAKELVGQHKRAARVQERIAVATRLACEAAEALGQSAAGRGPEEPEQAAPSRRKGLQGILEDQGHNIEERGSRLFCRSCCCSASRALRRHWADEGECPAQRGQGSTPKEVTYQVRMGTKILHHSHQLAWQEEGQAWVCLACGGQASVRPRKLAQPCRRPTKFRVQSDREQAQASAHNFPNQLRAATTQASAKVRQQQVLARVRARVDKPAIN